VRSHASNPSRAAVAMSGGLKLGPGCRWCCRRGPQPCEGLVSPGINRQPAAKISDGAQGSRKPRLSASVSKAVAIVGLPTPWRNGFRGKSAGCQPGWLTRKAASLTTLSLIRSRRSRPSSWSTDLERPFVSSAPGNDERLRWKPASSVRRYHAAVAGDRWRAITLLSRRIMMSLAESFWLRPPL